MEVRECRHETALLRSLRGAHLRRPMPHGYLDRSVAIALSGTPAQPVRLQVCRANVAIHRTGSGSVPVIIVGTLPLISGLETLMPMGHSGDEMHTECS